MKNVVRFEELRPDQLKRIIARYGIIYLPLGTLEWHERHLPFGLDAFVSYELCLEACKKTGGCVIPPIYFGTDREHKIRNKVFHGMNARAERMLEGSIYFLRKNFFLKFLRQIIENIERQGFKKVVIVSAHSGTAQQAVLEEIAKEKSGSMKTIVVPGKLFIGGMDHAGKIETSLMLALKSSLVDLSKLQKPYEAISGEDPLTASKKLGEVRLKKIVAQIIARVKS